FAFSTLKVNGINNGFNYNNINPQPVIKISFSAALNPNSITGSVTFSSKAGTAVAYTTAYENHDSTIVITPSALQAVTQYVLVVSTDLKSETNGSLQTGVNVQLTTAVDTTNKFPVISDNALLDLVQKQTFKYFWDFGHPVSGLARERNTSGDVVTTGGCGFGVMALLTGVSRNFITRAKGLARMQTSVGFLKNNAQTFHGDFPHWLNGSTGAVVPFSTQDDGADL